MRRDRRLSSEGSIRREWENRGPTCLSAVTVASFLLVLDPLLCHCCTNSIVPVWLGYFEQNIDYVWVDWLVKVLGGEKLIIGKLIRRLVPCNGWLMYTLIGNSCFLDINLAALRESVVRTRGGMVICVALAPADGVVVARKHDHR